METKPEFEHLVDTFSEELYAYLWRLFGEGNDSEDCLQETFLRAYRAYPKLKEITNLRAWLYRIATNTAYTHLRRRARSAARTSSLDPKMASSTPTIPDLVEQRLTLADIRRAVDSLPRRQQTALLMRKYQGLSYAEIATALDCREDAARANVYQALKKLRSLFSPASIPAEDL